MILVDDMGWGEVGIYGSKYCQTPHLDNLAKQGMRFTNFYANSTVCSPTRAALMTGRYPDLVGVPGVIRGNVENSWGYFSPKVVTLPQVLKTGGYQTQWSENGTWDWNPKTTPTGEVLCIFTVFWKI